MMNDFINRKPPYYHVEIHSSYLTADNQMVLRTDNGLDNVEKLVTKYLEHNKEKGPISKDEINHVSQHYILKNGLDVLVSSHRYSPTIAQTRKGALHYVPSKLVLQIRGSPDEVMRFLYEELFSKYEAAITVVRRKFHSKKNYGISFPSLW